MRYQVIFCQGDYSHVDAECDTYDNAFERKTELQAEMYQAGERNFYYIIKEVRDDEEVDIPEDDYDQQLDDCYDDILEDDDFNTLCGR